jgi:hypothetical protein
MSSVRNGRTRDDTVREKELFWITGQLSSTLFPVPGGLSSGLNWSHIWSNLAVWDAVGTTGSPCGEGVVAGDVAQVAGVVEGEDTDVVAAADLKAVDPAVGGDQPGGLFGVAADRTH